MKEEVNIIVTEDDEGHASLIQKNLKRAGISNPILHFKDGEETLNFLFRREGGPHRKTETAYLLLLDIRMSKVDGLEVLQHIKKDSELRKMPVIMITTADDPKEVETCHYLGCNTYITKPVDYDRFVEAIRQLGLFLLVVEVPKIDGESA